MPLLSDAREATSGRRGVLLAVAAITVLAAVLRLALIGHQGYWMDEGITIGVLHKSLGTMLHDLSFRETTPPLYYILAWFWARMAGYGEAPLRTLSALVGIATVPIAYAAGARIISRRVGVIVAALAATSPLLVWYSQEVRPYALLVLLASLSLLAFEIARTNPTQTRLIAWGIVSGLAIFAHYFAAIIVLPEALWLLWANRRHWATWVAAAIPAVVGLALIPLIEKQEKLADWITKIPIGDRLRQIRIEFIVGFTGPHFHIEWLIAVAVALLAVVLLLSRADRLERRQGLGMAAIGAAGLVIAALITILRKDVINTRNLLELWLPFAIFLGAGLGARRAGVIGTTGAVVLSTIGLAGTIYIDSDSSLQRPDWRPISTALGPPPAVGSRILLILRYGSLFPMTLYHPHMHNTPSTWVGRVSELDFMYAARAPHAGDCWWGGACQLTPVRLKYPPHLPGFHVVQVVHRGRFVLLRLRSPVPRRETVGAVFSSLPRFRVFPSTVLYETRDERALHAH